MSSNSGFSAATPPVRAETARRAARCTAFGVMVWPMWGVLLLADLALVWHFGSNVPRQDEWSLVPYLTGEVPVTPAWLWSQVNEYRLPLPRLVLLALYRVTGADFRAPLVFNVLALGGLAALLIVTAARLRGSADWGDTFFPLLILHPGHYYNLLTGWQVQFVLPAALVGIFACATCAATVTWPGLLAAGLCAGLLPFCGANGVVLVPFLALWLAVVGVRRWRRGAPSQAAWAWVVGCFTFLVAVAYFVDLRPVRQEERTRGFSAFGRTTAEVLSLGFGPPPLALWQPWAVAVACFFVLAAALLVRSWMRWPCERLRSGGLLAALAGVAAVVAAVGAGRGGRNPLLGLSHHYVILVVPGLVLVYLALLVAAPAWLGRFVGRGLALASGGMLVLNIPTGLAGARAIREQAGLFERDIRAGLPPLVLSERYALSPTPTGVSLNKPERLRSHLAALQRAGIGLFDAMRPDPEYREIPLTPGEQGFVTWKAPKARHVYAVRLRVMCHEPQAGYDRFRVSWGATPGGRPARDLVPALPRQAGEQSVLLWVDDDMAYLQVSPEPGAPRAAWGVTLLAAP